MKVRIQNKVDSSVVQQKWTIHETWSQSDQTEGTAGNADFFRQEEQGSKIDFTKIEELSLIDLPALWKYFNILSKQSTSHAIERSDIHFVQSSDSSDIIPVKKTIDLTQEEKTRLVSKIRACYFEPGIINDADRYFSSLVKEHNSFDEPLKILSDITNHNIDDDHILEGVLHILSNYEYSEIDPFGISIVLASAVNHSPVIQDLLISCFENWGDRQGIDILEKLDINTEWIKQYRDEVIDFLKSESK